MTAQGGLSSDAQALMAFESGKKSTGVAYLLWFFTGGFGGHRFYMGLAGSAVFQLILTILGWSLLAAGGFGLVFLIPLGFWLLIDAATLGGKVSRHNQALMARLNTAPRQIYSSSADDLAKFAALRDSGAISGDEYEAQKRRILGAPADAII